MTAKTLSTYVSDQNSIRTGNGWNTTWATNLDTVGISTNGANSVIGWQSGSLPASQTGGVPNHNTVLLDGPRSQYLVDVNARGIVTVEDSSNGQSMEVAGASYLIFNGGSETAGSYDQIMFVEKGPEAEVARLYQADLGRMPDLAGLEAWSRQVESGAQNISQVASAFIGSQEFQDRFGANLDDQHFVTALYQNVLGRNSDQSGLTAWVNYLHSETVAIGSDQARTTLLLDFTDSSECITHTSSWMVDTSRQTYHDTGLTLAASSALTNGEASGYVDLTMVNNSTWPTGSTALAVGGISFQHDATTGLPILSVTQNDVSVALSSSTPYVAVIAARDTFITPTAGGSYIEIASAGSQNDNTVVMQGASNLLNIGVTVSNGYCTATPVNTTVTGYIPGSDSLYLPTTTLHQQGALSLPVRILDGTHGQIDGNSLNFLQSVYVLDVGNVGDGSAASVAAAANAAYSVSDKTGSSNFFAAYQAAGEYLTIMGETSSHDTVIYQFARLNYVTFNNANIVVAHFTADANGNHLVDAAELIKMVTLVGVDVGTLTAADFHS